MAADEGPLKDLYTHSAKRRRLEFVPAVRTSRPAPPESLDLVYLRPKVQVRFHASLLPPESCLDRPGT